ncbi:MAG TPA: DUF655 domain-containing protein [Candidatus Hodarchaeales archaeon]|nr:DUF655 domain-containing protein [Candidatus Hodarchaeales archaeon]
MPNGSSPPPTRRDSNFSSHREAEDGHHYVHERRGIVVDISHDFLSDHSSFKKEFPVYYVLGVEHFTLLEIFLRKPILGTVVGDLVELETHKDEFQRVRRINFDLLPKGAEYALEEMLTKLIREQSERFVKFFNEAKPVTVKLHQLTLLPGVGQKRMWTVLDARKAKPFDSYSDIEARAGLDPVAVVVKRILNELSGKERHNLFVR